MFLFLIDFTNNKKGVVIFIISKLYSNQLYFVPNFFFQYLTKPATLIQAGLAY
jgi:hypothetical protein